MALSNRGTQFSKSSDAGNLWKILQDLWHPEQNPGGFVSLGVAENALMHTKLADHINNNMAIPTPSLTYGDGPVGGKRIKQALARFLTRKLKPSDAILPEHITVTNGCTAALEHLAFSLADPGDVFLLGRPHYRAFIDDFSFRTGAVVTTVSFGDIDPMSVAAVAKYEEQIVLAQSWGKRVAGLILAHPHNPLGRCYSQEALKEIMKLCQKYQVHLISDEIYAFSTFTNTVDTGADVVTFQSALAMNPVEYMDPALLHFVWGMSKDFGANGIRIGVLVSQHNPSLLSSIVPAALYSSASSLAEHATSNILEDDNWVDDFIQENQAKLADNYAYAVEWARKHGIEYAPGVTAGFFLWLNLGSAYRLTHPEFKEGDDITEMMANTLRRHKVFLASGSVFGAEYPGWFRLVFSQERLILDEGIRRITAALNLMDHLEEPLSSDLRHTALE